MQAEPRSTDISSDVGMEKNEAMLPTNIKVRRVPFPLDNTL